MSYVMMAVPSELVAAVSEFIESHPREGADQGDRVTDGFVHGWDAPTVRRAYRESADEMRRVLDFLADNPGREVSSDEVAEAIDARYGWNTVAGMLGAFGRRCRGRYGRDLPMWEFRESAEGRTLLTLPAAAAAAIRDAQDGHKDSGIS